MHGAASCISTCWPYQVLEVLLFGEEGRKCTKRLPELKKINYSITVLTYKHVKRINSLGTGKGVKNSRTEIL